MKGMEGIWRVSTTYAGGSCLYQVFRLRNKNDVDHSGNREVVATFENEDEAMVLAAKMNVEYGERIWSVKYLVRWETHEGYESKGFETAIVAPNITKAGYKAHDYIVRKHSAELQQIAITSICMADPEEKGTCVGRSVQDYAAKDIWQTNRKK